MQARADLTAPFVLVKFRYLKNEKPRETLKNLSERRGPMVERQVLSGEWKSLR